MQIRVTGTNIEVGQSLTQYVQENLEREVKKYFENAIDAEVFFSKEGPHLVKAIIVVNEGVRGGIAVKSTGQAGEAYGAFTESLERAAKQLRRYKRKIKNYRRQGGGIKNVEPNYEILGAVKSVILPEKYDIFSEIEQEIDNNSSNLTIIDEKETEIENLTVDEALMKMDLRDLPALVFINKDNGRINVVYHRKDGNISWVNPRK